MNRRSFLAGLSALVGGIALEQAIPFNRVWSFPKQIVVRTSFPDIHRIDALALKHWFRNTWKDDLEMEWTPLVPYPHATFPVYGKTDIAQLRFNAHQ